MQISREQYQRFLSNQCSEEERLLFNRCLEQHPEVIDQLLEAGDWEKFESDISLHPAFSTRMREQFLLFVQKAKKKKDTVLHTKHGCCFVGAYSFINRLVIA